jgi:hypothetical protein
LASDSETKEELAIWLKNAEEGRQKAEVSVQMGIGTLLTLIYG